MLRDITITINPIGLKVRAEIGTTPLELFRSRREEFTDILDGDPILCLVNNHTRSLDLSLMRDCTIEYLDIHRNAGRRAYARTLALLLYKAADDLGLSVKVEHAISHGYYGVVVDKRPLPKDTVSALKGRMEELIREDCPITRSRVPSSIAIEHFRTHHRRETADLIEAQGKFYVTLTEIAGYTDFLFGITAPSAGCVPLFGLENYFDGFLLRVPDATDPHKLSPWVAQPKLFQVFSEHISLISMLGVEDAGPLNRKIREGKAADLITIAEARQERNIAEIAAEIARRHREEGLRIILIAGPSSSGKTTTSMRLRTQLITNLLEPHAIALDNFYVNRTETPLDEYGELDYESLHAIDLAFLNDVLNRLTEGETVQMPTYNFQTGLREMRSENTLTLGDQDILIFEGIHGLNPELLRDVDQTKVFKIYVSALTTLSLDSHNWLSTSDNRLLRRIVRDLKYRGTTAEGNILRWNSVRAGEEKWIFPFQENADAVFNSAMMYEFAALRPQAEVALAQVPEVSPAFPTAERLLRLLRLFEPIELKHMPPTSLMREFLGGSSFSY